jgi:hypothetical protein
MSVFSLSDFIPSYPDYEKNENDLFNVYNEDMYEVLQRKKEFKELVLGRIENYSPGLMKHQLFVQRFLSDHTPYTGLLVWHEVGTGKTITAIAVAEALKKSMPNKALVLVKGATVAQNFKDQIQIIAPDYTVDEDNRPLTQTQVNKELGKTYTITTFRKFCNMIGPLIERQPEQIKKEYSNRVIIIDEVHNLREDGEEKAGSYGLYNTFFKLLHMVENCKIILLSATPMKDRPKEFADIMNLILPLSRQIKNFEDDYFDTVGDRLQFKTEKRDELLQKVKGYISYLRQQSDDSIIKVYDLGVRLPGIEGFNVIPLQMNETQSLIYNRAWSQDVQSEQAQHGRARIIEGGIYERSRQAVLSSYPRDDLGNEYGSSRTGQRIELHDDHKEFGNLANSILNVDVAPEQKRNAQLEKLKSYSVKYHYVVDKALKGYASPDSKGRKQFVYCRFVEGSGLFLLRSLLQKFGYKPFPVEHMSRANPFFGLHKGKYFALITSNTSNNMTSDLLYAYNHIENRHGEYLQLILGSATMGESRTLKCVRDIIIMTPHWNYTDTEQAIGRVIRYQSHSDLDQEDQTVTIHRLMAYPNTEADNASVQDTKSIDRHMYQTSYKKDLVIKQVEDIAREIAVDCTFNKARNERLGYEGERECFYKECEYTCHKTSAPLPEYKDTYHLFYGENEYRLIKDYLQTLFQTTLTYKYSCDQLITLIQSHSGFPTHVILRCLNDIIQHQETFVSPNGFTAFLKEHHNMFFLSYNLFFTDESDIFYTQKGQVHPNLNHDMYLKYLEEQLFPTPAFHHFITLHKDLSMDHLKELMDIDEHVKRVFIKCCIQITSEMNRTDLVPILNYAVHQNILSDHTTFIEPPESYQQKDGVWGWHLVEIQLMIESEIIAMSYALLKTDAPAIAYNSEEGFKVFILENDPNTRLKNLTYGKTKGTVCPTLNGTKLKHLYRQLFGEETQESREKICMALEPKLKSIFPFEEIKRGQSLVFKKQDFEAIKTWCNLNKPLLEQKLREP